MEHLLIGLLACLIAGWIWAEYKIKAPETRLVLGGVLILFLIAILYANEVRCFYHRSHHAAAIRLLGETIDDGDVESARSAIHEYQAQSPGQNAYTIISFLADRNRNKVQ